MFGPGVYPASVTPLQANGAVDIPGLARLLAWFEAGGCRGAVLAGTHGEGPSLSAVEKRDMLAAAMEVRGKLDLVLGIATPSLHEATWLCRQAARLGAIGVLVMPPFYFREAPEAGIEAWFDALLEDAPLPVLAYNFPQKTGVTLSADLLGRLARHTALVGAKDSSGDPANLSAYRAALGPEAALYVGNETLLLDALRAGWTGTISGAANVLPDWLSQIRAEWDTYPESAEAKFAILRPAIDALRSLPQPAGSKGALAKMGVLPSGRVRPPLIEAGTEAVDALLAQVENAVGPRGRALPA